MAVIMSMAVVMMMCVLSSNKFFDQKKCQDPRHDPQPGQGVSRMIVFVVIMTLAVIVNVAVAMTVMATARMRWN